MTDLRHLVSPILKANPLPTYLLEQLQRRLGDHPHVGEIRGLGLMAAIEPVADRNTKEEFPPEDKVGIRIHQAAQDRGLFSRLRGDVFCLAPPIIITESQIDRIAEIMEQSVVAVLGE